MWRLIRPLGQDGSVHYMYWERVSSGDLVDLELESHLDRSVPCPLQLGQPAHVFGRSQNHCSGR